MAPGVTMPSPPKKKKTTPFLTGNCVSAPFINHLLLFLCFTLYRCLVFFLFDIKQWFSTVNDFAPQEYLAVSDDTSDCYNQRGTELQIEVETKDMLEILKYIEQGLMIKNGLVQYQWY